MVTPETPGITIAIIGVGPRGISVLERFGTALLAAQHDRPEQQHLRRPITIELIDKYEVGAGAIWQTQQTRTLCKNTLAGAVTLFAEPGATVTQPVFPGPTIWEWIQLSRGDHPVNVTKHTAELYRAFPTDPQVRAAFADEFAATTIDTHPSRALYGAYLQWCLRVAEARLPDNVTVRHRVAEVVGITEVSAPSGRNHDMVRCDDGSMLAADATVLATGWTQPALTASEADLADIVADTGLTWVRHGNPVEQRVEELPAGQPVLVRGLGMGFFDLMALVTINRGGAFIADEHARSGLRYQPSGAEPHLLVSSGRGYPYLPKSKYGSLPPAPKLWRTRPALAALPDNAAQGTIDFADTVWPALARDAHEAYYRTLADTRPEAIVGSVDELIAALDSAPIGHFDEGLTAAAAAWVPNAADRLSLAHEADRVGRTQLPPAEFTEFIAEQVTADLAAADAARTSPVKNGLWELAASRQAVALKTAGGRTTPGSRGLVADYFALARQAGSGPPAFRTQQLLALVDAGIVSFVGGRPTVRIDRDGDGAASFVMTSDATEGHEFRATALADAWMYSPDIRRPGTQLGQQLVGAGRVRPFQVPAAGGSWADTGSPEIDRGTRRVVRVDGSIDPRLHVIGIPTYAQEPDTTISPAPGTDATLLQETDATATSLLSMVEV